MFILTFNEFDLEFTSTTNIGLVEDESSAKKIVNELNLKLNEISRNRTSFGCLKLNDIKLTYVSASSKIFFEYQRISPLAEEHNTLEMVNLF